MVAKVFITLVFLGINFLVGAFPVYGWVNTKANYPISNRELNQVFSFDVGSFLTTYKGNNLLVLVNKKIALPANFVPVDLEKLDGHFLIFNQNLFLRKEAYNQLSEMFTAAKSEGVTLSVVSAYRSWEQQRETFSAWVALAGKEEAETFSALPGHSQHQLGTAVDLSGSLGPEFTSSFGQTKEGIWLMQNAFRFGFVMSYPEGKEALTGYTYEPWHFRYVGVEAAKQIKQTGITLEEYLQKFGTW